MTNYKNPFEQESASDKLSTPTGLGAVLLGLLLVSLVISKTGIVGSVALFAIPFLIVYLIILFKHPIVGLYTSGVFGFILLGIGRYIKGIPIGFGMDFLLLGTYLALIFSRFRTRVDWTPAKQLLTLFSFIWFLYAIFQLVNPEARSVEAWISGRGISLYMLMLIPLTYLFIDNEKKIDVFLLIWGIMSILVTIKGIMQHFIGPDPFERAWLDEGNYKTHILFGQLRSFSFLSDAGQYGANQAYSAVVASILVSAHRKKTMKLFFLVVALLGFYGLVISGTRGAISVPLTGFMAFFIMRKNKAVMISGFFLLILVFVFFKYTNIGQGNNQIRRMRTAFDPNDASLQVRLENQRKLKVYMASRPLGGGIGHGGVKAQKYLPHAFLSNVATDSWYVLIWVEQGVIGLLMHLFILFYVVIRAGYQIMFRIRDPILRLKLASITSGMFGIMVASYGNAVLGQMPTSILIYISMGIIANCERFEKTENSIIQNPAIPA